MRNEDMIETVRKKFERLAGVLDERGRRVWAAVEAEVLGYGEQSTLPKPPVYREQRFIMKAWKKIKTYRSIIGFAFGKRTAAVQQFSL